jgi:hypothetical protein
MASYRKLRLIIVKGEQDIPDEKERFNEDDDDNVQRDLELENIAGNLMIAEYQVDKLDQKLIHHLRGVGYRSFDNMKKHLLILSNMMANGISFQLK